MKKLILRKNSIAKLNDFQLNGINGGVCTTTGYTYAPCKATIICDNQKL